MHRLKAFLKCTGGRFKQSGRDAPPGPGSRQSIEVNHAPPFDRQECNEYNPEGGHQVFRSTQHRPVKDDHAVQLEQSSRAEIREIQADYHMIPKNATIVQQELGVAKPDEQDDLWQQAMYDLEVKEQENILNLIGTEDTPTVHESNDLCKIVREAVEEVRRKQVEHEKRSSIYKTADNIIEHLTLAGDFAINFTPAVAQQVWPVARWLLRIPLLAAEQMDELFQIADLVSHAIALGCVYETYLNRTNTPRDPLKILHECLRGVYKCALQLMAMSAELLDKNPVAFIASSVWKPDDIIQKSKDFASLRKQLEEAVLAAQVAKTSRSDALLNLYLEKWGFSMAEIDKRLVDVLGKMQSREEDELLNWTSDILYGDHLKSILNRLAPLTCNWILRHRRFQEWESSTSGSFIWLQGTVGTGKSFLTSWIIKHKQDFLEGSSRQNLKHEGLAFFFFNRDEPSRNTTLSCLRSLVRQLSRPYGQSIRLSPALHKLRKQCDREARSLSIEDCKEQLQSIRDQYPRTTIIIDALDECCKGDSFTGRQALVTFLADLTEKSNRRPLNILVSGRPEGDILNAFQRRDKVIISAEDNGDDIQRFLEHIIENDERVATRWQASLKKKVIKEILEKSKSVFRLADLHITSVVQHGYILGSDVDKAIKNLPDNLKEMYDQIYAENVGQKDSTAAKIVRRAIMWVLAANDPLTSDQILSAVHIDPVTYLDATLGYAVQNSRHWAGSTGSMPVIDGHFEPDTIEEDTLLDLCANFLFLDEPQDMWPSKRYWRFCHASVSEYWEENHFGVSDAHSHVGAASLMVCIESHRQNIAKGAQSGLTNFNFDSQSSLSSRERRNCRRGPVAPSPSSHSPSSLPIRNSLFNYCSDTWPTHVKLVVDSMTAKDGESGHSGKTAREEHRNVLVSAKSLDGLLRQFIGQPNKSSEEFHSWVANRGSLWDKQTLALHAVASFGVIELGFNHIFKSWLKALPINKAGGQKDNALEQPMVDLTLQTNKGWNLLQWACYHGNTEIVKELVSNAGMDAQDVANGTQSPLSLACEEDHLDLCKALIEDYGCDPNRPSNFYNPLYVAAEHCNTEIIRELLRRGANPNQELTVEPTSSDRPPSSLAVAIDSGYFGAMRVLVEEGGADPNKVFPNAKQSTAAITAASHVAHLDYLEYLVHLDRHVDTFEDADLGQRRVDPNATITTGRYGSILSAAMSNFHFNGELYDVALDRLAALGINFNTSLRYPLAPSDAYPFGSALEYFVSRGDLKRTKDLVEKFGADVDYCSEYGVYGCALIAGIRAYGSNMFWEQGDEISEHDNQKRREMVHYIVEKGGANVNLQVPHGGYHSPLVGAAVLGGLEEIEYLIKKGAELNQVLEYGEHRSALMAAAAAGKEAAVWLLIEKGADVNRPENLGWEDKLHLGQELMSHRRIFLRSRNSIVEWDEMHGWPSGCTEI